MKKTILLSMIINVLCYSSAFCISSDSSIKCSTASEKKEEKCRFLRDNYDEDALLEEDSNSNNEDMNKTM